MKARLIRAGEHTYTLLSPGVNEMRVCLIRRGAENAYNLLACLRCWWVVEVCVIWRLSHAYILLGTDAFPSLLAHSSPRPLPGHTPQWLSLPSNGFTSSVLKTSSSPLRPRSFSFSSSSYFFFFLLGHIFSLFFYFFFRFYPKSPLASLRLYLFLLHLDIYYFFFHFLLFFLSPFFSSSSFTFFIFSYLSLPHLPSLPSLPIFLILYVLSLLTRWSKGAAPLFLIP